MIQDLPLFKKVPLRAEAASSDEEWHGPPEHTDAPMLPVLLTQGFREHSWALAHERVLEAVLACLGAPLPWHPEQLHVDEYVALHTREVLFNLDLSVEAKKHRTIACFG